MLASTLGVEFDPSAAWSEKEQTFKMAKEIVRTFNITQTAQGHKDGLWTTVIAAAVLLPATSERIITKPWPVAQEGVVGMPSGDPIYYQPLLPKAVPPPDAPVQIKCQKPLDI
jgi:hypothetical protein